MPFRRFYSSCQDESNFSYWNGIEKINWDKSFWKPCSCLSHEDLDYLDDWISISDRMRWMKPIQIFLSCLVIRFYLLLYLSIDWNEHYTECFEQKRWCELSHDWRVCILQLNKLKILARVTILCKYLCNTQRPNYLVKYWVLQRMLPNSLTIPICLWVQVFIG